MSQRSFEFITFQEGVTRIKQSLADHGFGSEYRDSVTTSQDEHAIAMREALKIGNLPEGITKWQLPIYWEGKGAQFFISVAAPNTKIEEHSHSEGDGLRFVVGGSISHEGRELGVGDWMFIPQNVPYSLQVGDMGAIMCYCYQCCCVIK